MEVIDFGNSYVTFFGRQEAGGNIARLLVDAACTVVEEGTGKAETFYLIAPCRAERMYLEGDLFQMPNYEFCGIFADDDLMLVRTGWTSDRDNREYGVATERFAKVERAIRQLANPRALSDDEEIVGATLANLPLVARTELRDEGRGRRAVLEYPVKTMNVTQEPPRFQVDTGPLLLPDFGSAAEHPVERFEIAHVVYHGFDRAEFILRKPIPVGERDGQEVSVSDYTVVQVVSARNEIFCGDDA